MPPVLLRLPLTINLDVFNKFERVPRRPLHLGDSAAKLCSCPGNSLTMQVVCSGLFCSWTICLLCIYEKQYNSREVQNTVKVCHFLLAFQVATFVFHQSILWKQSTLFCETHIKRHGASLCSSLLIILMESVIKCPSFLQNEG